MTHEGLRPRTFAAGMLFAVVSVLCLSGFSAISDLAANVRVVRGSGTAVVDGRALRFHPTETNDNWIEAFQKTEKVAKGAWRVSADICFDSPHLFQFAGVYVGDGEKMIKLVIGKLALNGSDFNVGFGDAASHLATTTVPHFKGGDRLILELTGLDGKVYATYRSFFSDKKRTSSTFVGVLPGIDADRAGVVFGDERVESRLRRIPAGAISNGYASIRGFRVEEGVDSRIETPKLFMRMKLKAAEPQNVLAAVTLYEKSHNKQFQFGLGKKSGVVRMSPHPHRRQDWKAMLREDRFSCGDVSGWFDVSDYFVMPHDGKRMVVVFCDPSNPQFPRGSDSGNVRAFDVEIEFATEPDVSKVVKRVSASARHYCLTLVMPPNRGSAAEWGPKIRTWLEYTKDRYAAATAGGAKPFEKAKFINIERPDFRGNFLDFIGPEGAEAERKIYDLLGINLMGTMAPQLPKVKDWDYWSPSLRKMMRESIERRRDVPDGPIGVKIGDEPSLIAIDRLKGSADGMRRFRQYIKSKVGKPGAVGVSSFDELQPIARNDVKTLEQARLFYHQVFFLQESTWAVYRDWSAEFKRRYPQAILGTDAYFSGFADAPDYFVEARMGACDVQKHHYGSGDTSTRQIFGNFFLADMFRSAAEFGKIDTGMLWFVCRLAGDRGVRLTGISAMIRNLHNVYLYGYGPAKIHSEWFSDDEHKVEAFVAASELLKAWSQYEDYLVFAPFRDARVAVLLSRGNSIWEGVSLSDMSVAFAHDDARERTAQDFSAKGAYSTGYAAERAMIAGTLGLNAYRCDVLPTEEMSRLGRYSALYVHEPVLEEGSGHAILKWVKGGGVLYLGAGAAERNEFNECCDWLKSAFDGKVTRKVVSGERNRYKIIGGYGEVYRLGARYTEEDAAKKMVTLDKVRVGSSEFRVLGLKQELTLPDGAEVIARYSDEKAAVAVLPLGKGKVVLAGVPLGITLAGTADPGFDTVVETDLPPFTLRGAGTTACWRRTFDKNAEKLILLPALLAGIEREAKIPVSGIDVGVREKSDKTGAVVMLGRYTSKSTDNHPVVVRLQGDYHQVKAFSGRPVRLHRQGEEYALTVALDDYDVIELLP